MRADVRVVDNFGGRNWLWFIMSAWESAGMAGPSHPMRRRARVDPWPVIRVADDRWDSPGWEGIGFDKALGADTTPVLRPTAGGAFRPRPAYSLVAGNVHYLPSGECREHVGVLSAQQVRDISDDLET